MTNFNRIQLSLVLITQQDFEVAQFSTLVTQIVPTWKGGPKHKDMVKDRACSSYECFILRARRLYSKLLKRYRGTLEIVIQEVLWLIWGSYSTIWSTPLTNIKWHSDPWATVTSQSIRLSTNFMTLIPSLTFTDYKWFPWSICNGCGMPAGNAYPSGPLIPSPIVGLACASIDETRFLELAMSLLDFSPRILLGTISILLMYNWFPDTTRVSIYLAFF